MAALQARLALRATVIRDGKQQEIPIHDVVVGDVVVLGAGDIVPGRRARCSKPTTCSSTSRR